MPQTPQTGASPTAVTGFPRRRPGPRTPRRLTDPWRRQGTGRRDAGLDKPFEEALALAEGPFAALLRALIRPVLDLDAHGPLVAHVGQRREQPAPVHVAEARQLRRFLLF